MTTLHPILSQVLVLLDAPERMTAGGLHIPATIADKNTALWGEVLDAGDDVTTVFQGDRVFTKPHTGYHYREGGRDFLVIPEDKILCREKLA